MNSEQPFYGGIMDCARDVRASGHMTKARGGASMSLSISDSHSKPTCGIYAIVNKTNGHRYIGSSWNIARRLTSHSALLLKGKHHSPHLQHAWNLYGPDSFDVVVLCYCERRDLLIFEQRFLDTLNPEYNVCVTAGSKAGTPRSEETRRKLALANLGKKQSVETRLKRSAALRGITRSEEFKKKVSAAHMGVPKRPHTEEAKQRISSALTGRRLSEEDKRKKSIAALGNKRTLGLQHTDETKAKMSEIRKAWWAAKKAEHDKE